MHQSQSVRPNGRESAALDFPFFDLDMNNAIGASWDAGYRLVRHRTDVPQRKRHSGDALKFNQIPRDEIFLISKVDNSNQWYQPIDSLQESLKNCRPLSRFLLNSLARSE